MIPPNHHVWLLKSFLQGQLSKGLQLIQNLVYCSPKLRMSFTIASNVCVMLRPTAIGCNWLAPRSSRWTFCGSHGCEKCLHRRIQNLHHDRQGGWGWQPCFRQRKWWTWCKIASWCDWRGNPVYFLSPMAYAARFHRYQDGRGSTPARLNELNSSNHDHRHFLWLARWIYWLEACHGNFQQRRAHCVGQHGAFGGGTLYCDSSIFDQREFRSLLGSEICLRRADESQTHSAHVRSRQSPTCSFHSSSCVPILYVHFDRCSHGRLLWVFDLVHELDHRSCSVVWPDQMAGPLAGLSQCLRNPAAKPTPFRASPIRLPKALRAHQMRWPVWRNHFGTCCAAQCVHVDCMFYRLWLRVLWLELFRRATVSQSLPQFRAVVHHGLRGLPGGHCGDLGRPEVHAALEFSGGLPVFVYLQHWGAGQSFRVGLRADRTPGDRYLLRHQLLGPGRDLFRSRTGGRPPHLRDRCTAREHPSTLRGHVAQHDLLSSVWDDLFCSCVCHHQFAGSRQSCVDFPSLITGSSLQEPQLPFASICSIECHSWILICKVAQKPTTTQILRIQISFADQRPVKTNFGDSSWQLLLGSSVLADRCYFFCTGFTSTAWWKDGMLRSLIIPGLSKNGL